MLCFAQISNGCYYPVTDEKYAIVKLFSIGLIRTLSECNRMKHCGL